MKDNFSLGPPPPPTSPQPPPVALIEERDPCRPPPPPAPRGTSALRAGWSATGGRRIRVIRACGRGDSATSRSRCGPVPRLQARQRPHVPGEPTPGLLVALGWVVGARPAQAEVPTSLDDLGSRHAAAVPIARQLLGQNTLPTQSGAQVLRVDLTRRRTYTRQRVRSAVCHFDRTVSRRTVGVQFAGKSYAPHNASSRSPRSFFVLVRRVRPHRPRRH